MIPQSVRDVIARRLAHLSEDCNRVLVLASVLGREFAVRTLARTADLSGGRDPGHASTRPLLHASSPTSRAAAGGSASPTSSSATRSTRGSGPRAASVGIALPSRRWPSCTATSRDRTSANSRTTPLPAATSTRGCSTPAGPGIGRWSCSPTRRPRASTRRRSMRSTSPIRGTRAFAASSFSFPLGEAEIRAGDSSAAKKAFFEAAGVARRLGLVHELAQAAVGYGGPDHVFESRGRRSARAAARGRPRRARRRRCRDSSQASRPARRCTARRALSASRRDALAGRRSSLPAARGIQWHAAYALDGRAAAIVAPDTVEECFALGSELVEIATQSGDIERLLCAGTGTGSQARACRRHPQRGGRPGSGEGLRSGS